MVTVTIDGKSDLACRRAPPSWRPPSGAGIPVPHLCYLKDINEIAACRVCVVEVEGIDRLVPACNNQVAEGMVVHTNSPRVRQARQTNLQPDPQPARLPTAPPASAAATARLQTPGQRPEHPSPALSPADAPGQLGPLHPPDPPGEQVHQVHALRPGLRQGPES